MVTTFGRRYIGAYRKSNPNSKWKKNQKRTVYFPGYIMVKANLTGEFLTYIKSVTNVIGFLGETKGGEPVPLRESEVNRMLGKVDELALTTEHISIPFTVGETC